MQLTITTLAYTVVMMQVIAGPHLMMEMEMDCQTMNLGDLTPVIIGVSLTLV